jgi:hypothetical protein
LAAWARGLPALEGAPAARNKAPDPEHVRIRVLVRSAGQDARLNGRPEARRYRWPHAVQNDAGAPFLDFFGRRCNMLALVPD